MNIPQHLPWKPTRKTLGRGGQGQVCVVTSRETDDDTEYALKKLSKSSSQQARRRFRREIEVIKDINHHSIIKVVDHAEEHEDFQYYVMEYHKDAQPLSRIIASPCTNPYFENVMLSLDLFEQIVTAIDAYHHPWTGIVHRDIKPQNILVLNDSSICLIDFGICQIEDGSPITLTDENVGARYYMAPECGAGNEDEIGVNSDIYSAAKVLWSAITSQQIFDREKPVFNSRSMKNMFPTKPNLWHLAHIFERTIRELPENRVLSASDTLTLIDQVRYVVQREFPPLEEVKSRCPSCGLRSIGEFPKARQVFGEYESRKAAAFQCFSCGFVFLRNTELLQDNLTKKANFR